jgi:hypothetical protein
MRAFSEKTKRLQQVAPTVDMNPCFAPDEQDLLVKAFIRELHGIYVLPLTPDCETPLPEDCYR